MQRRKAEWQELFLVSAWLGSCQRDRQLSELASWHAKARKAQSFPQEKSRKESLACSGFSLSGSRKPKARKPVELESWVPGIASDYVNLDSCFYLALSFNLDLS